jgi:hypothetical protein
MAEVVNQFVSAASAATAGEVAVFAAVTVSLLVLLYTLQR